MSLGIKRTRPIRVAMRTFEGTIVELPLEFENLFSWARRRNLRIGETDHTGRNPLPWASVLHDEADMTPDSSRRIDLWIPIESAGAASRYLIKDITHESVAFQIYKGRCRSSRGVDQLFTWLQSKSLTFRGRIAPAHLHARHRRPPRRIGLGSRDPDPLLTSRN